MFKQQPKKQYIYILIVTIKTKKIINKYDFHKGSLLQLLLK